MTGSEEALARPAGRQVADPRDKEIARLKKDKERLTGDLAKARGVIEVQGKVSALLEQLATGSAEPTGVRAEVTIDEAIGELAPSDRHAGGVCGAGRRSRATYYRQHRRSLCTFVQPEHGQHSRGPCSVVERAEVLGLVLYIADRFVDQAPASIYATLLDDGRYLCSVPTTYRLLRAEDEVRERRRQVTHPARIKPELVASAVRTPCGLPLG